MFPRRDYADTAAGDPIRFYYWPIIGKMYRRRVELCLAECKDGERILEVGFGSGVTFLNLSDMYKEIHGLDLSAHGQNVTALFESKGIKTFLQNGNVLNMPFLDNFFDTVLSISILEHLQPDEQFKAFQEIWRVLKPGGQLVYGVPIERPLMTFLFRVLGYDIRLHHHSTEKDVEVAAKKVFGKGQIKEMRTPLGALYQVGSFVKNETISS